MEVLVAQASAAQKDPYLIGARPLKTLVSLAALSALLGACSPAAQSERVAIARSGQPPFVQFDLGPNYLASPLPGGESLVPPPPATGSAELARDTAADQQAQRLRGTERFALAARDADLSTGAIPRAFSCAAGVAISDTNTPALAHLLRRAAGDFSVSTSAAKKLYARQRPFAVDGNPTCTPDDEKALRGNGSYPSGHSAIGYGTGLVLASVFPERAAALVKRGTAYGDSRRVCHVHWLSDVEAGRQYAAATFARLQNDATFRADLAAAIAETKAIVKAPAPDAATCAAEAAALAVG